MKISIPDSAGFLARAGSFAAERGAKAWVVGGCVRDWIIGKDTSDIDIISESDCAPLAAFCAETLGGRTTSFGQFGTLRLELPDGNHIDFARTRAETYSRPAALPEVAPATVEKDLLRRDFTVNAIAASITPDSFGDILDPFSGMDDIRSGTLKILHEASFQDDPTRMYRGCRFAGRFRWKFAPDTEKLLRRAAEGRLPELLSRERIAREFLLMLRERESDRCLRAVSDYSLDGFIFPEMPLGMKFPEHFSWMEKLGMMACSLEHEGSDFLKSLRLERGVFNELSEVASICTLKMSPKNELTPSQREIISSCISGLPPAALEPLYIDGEDLMEAGIDTGPRYARILDAAAKAQWDGKFKTRQDALRWLKNYSF